MTTEDAVVIEGATVVRETALAICVRVEGDDVWFPKALVFNESEVWSLANPGPGNLVVPRWLAEEKGFFT